MLASEQAIVIAGTGEDWPDGRTLTPRKPTHEPNGTLWFGADLDPEGDQVWFWMEEEAIRRMPDATPEARGAAWTRSTSGSRRTARSSAGSTLSRSASPRTATRG